MSKRYAYWLYKNLHTKPHEDRQSGKIIDTTWDQLLPSHDRLESAKAAAGDSVTWRAPVPRSRPSWLPTNAEWLPEYDHFSADGEWYILQYNVEAE